MFRSLYTAASGMTAQQLNLDNIANNLANSSTAGYASAQVDKKKIGQLAVAIQAAFQQMGVFPGTGAGGGVPISSNLSDHVALGKGDPQALPMGTIVYQDTHVAASKEEEDIPQLIPELEKSLGPELLRNEVALRTEIDGLVISLREIGFYESGSAQIRATSLPAFGRIALLLSNHRCRIRIEGHTDNVPIHNARFSDNWELSTARSSELVRLLITSYGFSPERLSAAGYAQYHPVSSNVSIETRAQNRRVDIVVLGVIHPGAAAKGSAMRSGDFAVGQSPTARDPAPAP